MASQHAFIFEWSWGCFGAGPPRKPCSETVGETGVTSACILGDFIRVRSSSFSFRGDVGFLSELTETRSCVELTGEGRGEVNVRRERSRLNCGEWGGSIGTVVHGKSRSSSIT